MFVRWPGKIEPGRVSDLLWYFPDVLPTVGELAAAEIPDDVDGISIVPELIGESAAGRQQAQHEYLYWEIGGQTAIRLKDWKAIQPRGGDREAKFGGRPNRADQAKVLPAEGLIPNNELSEVNGGPWASISELGIVGD